MKQNKTKEIERLKGALLYGQVLVKKLGRGKAQSRGIYTTNRHIRNKLKALGGISNLFSRGIIDSEARKRDKARKKAYEEHIKVLLNLRSYKKNKDWFNSSPPIRTSDKSDSANAEGFNTDLKEVQK